MGTVVKARTHVLLVDDDPAVLTTLDGVLSNHFEIEAHGSAETALPAAFSGRFDVVVTDWQMPGQDGIVFMKAVRARQPSLPFIVLTGKDAECRQAIALDMDVKRILIVPKSGDPTRLIGQIRLLASLAESKHLVNVTRRTQP